MSGGTRQGRVFIGPEPEPPGQHYGYLGEIRWSNVGIHLAAGAVSHGPYVAQDGEQTDEWGWVWVPLETDTLIPWHEVHLIAWQGPR